jgi:addiction module HigA family antidote
MENYIDYIAPQTLPGDLFVPGEHLKDVLKTRSIKQKDLAKQIAVRQNVLSELITGKRSFTPELAVRLEKALGIDAEFWLRLQARYDVLLIKMKQREQAINMEVMLV